MALNASFEDILSKENNAHLACLLKVWKVNKTDTPVCCAWLELSMFVASEKARKLFAWGFSLLTEQLLESIFIRKETLWHSWWGRTFKNQSVRCHLHYISQTIGSCKEARNEPRKRNFTKYGPVSLLYRVWIKVYRCLQSSLQSNYSWLMWHWRSHSVLLSYMGYKKDKGTNRCTLGITVVYSKSTSSVYHRGKSLKDVHSEILAYKCDVNQQLPDFSSTREETQVQLWHPQVWSQESANNKLISFLHGPYSLESFVHDCAYFYVVWIQWTALVESSAT